MTLFSLSFLGPPFSVLEGVSQVRRSLVLFEAVISPESDFFLVDYLAGNLLGIVLLEIL